MKIQGIATFLCLLMGPWLGLSCNQDQFNQGDVEDLQAYTALIYLSDVNNLCLNDPSTIETTQGATLGPKSGNQCYHLSTSSSINIQISGITPSGDTVFIKAWTPDPLSGYAKLAIPGAVPDLWVRAGGGEGVSYSITF